LESPTRETTDLRQEFFNEQIDVVCSFSKNQIRPLRFRRKNETIVIATTNGYWAKHEGAVLLHFFAVSDTLGTYYELQLNSKSLEWHLRKVVDEI